MSRRNVDDGSLRFLSLEQITEDVLKAQQAAYSVEGVDESVRCSLLAFPVCMRSPFFYNCSQAPAAPNKEDRKGKKRKAGDNGDKPAKKPRANTAVFVSKLPDSTTVDQLVSTFSKAGLILEDVNGDPKVKLYKDDAGRFKGEALIVYLQEASVELACRLFDETELELGSGAGTMSVKVAQWDNSSKDKEKEKGAGEGDKGEGTSSGNGASKKGKTDQEKARLGKKAAALRQCVVSSLYRTSGPGSHACSCRKLGDWSDDEDPAAAAARARKYRGVVVLEGMFTLKELEEDPTLLLDLKEDVREECETIGEVTNVTLYDVRVASPFSTSPTAHKLHGSAEGGQGRHDRSLQGGARRSSLHRSAYRLSAIASTVLDTP